MASSYEFSLRADSSSQCIQHSQIIDPVEGTPASDPPWRIVKVRADRFTTETLADERRFIEGESYQDPSGPMYSDLWGLWRLMIFSPP
jgi:hypothetical protein